MVDNNNYQTTNDYLSEENIVEKPNYENSYNNNEIQNQNQNNVSEPFIYPQPENETNPIENTQISNTQNDSKEAENKGNKKRRLISMAFCFFLIVITIGSEVLQLKLKLFSILLLVDDLIVFAMSIMYLCIFFFKIKINIYWFLIPHGIVLFGGIGFKVVGIRPFPDDDIFRLIQFFLLTAKGFVLFPIPCWLAL